MALKWGGPGEDRFKERFQKREARKADTPRPRRFESERIQEATHTIVVMTAEEFETRFDAKVEIEEEAEHDSVLSVSIPILPGQGFIGESVFDKTMRKAYGKSEIQVSVRHIPWSPERKRKEFLKSELLRLAPSFSASTATLEQLESFHAGLLKEITAEKAERDEFWQALESL